MGAQKLAVNIKQEARNGSLEVLSSSLESQENLWHDQHSYKIMY